MTKRRDDGRYTDINMWEPEKQQCFAVFILVKFFFWSRPGSAV